MESDNEFDRITVQGLIADDAFLKWVNQPDEALENRWKGLIDRHPELQPVVDEARALVRQLRFAEHRAPAERKQLVLDRIKAAAGMGQEERGKAVSMRRWVQVAASLSVFVLAGIWLYTRYVGKPTGGLGDSPQPFVASKEGRLFVSDGRALSLADWGSDGEHVLKLTWSADRSLVFADGPGQTALGVDSITSPMEAVFRVALPDGSQVWMNSGSTLRLAGRYTGARRGVGVTGQCYFTVAPDAGLPFTVAVGDREVTVLGTQFDVANYPDMRHAVTLIEGSVRLSGEAMPPVLLKPGQQAQIGHDGSPIVADVDVTRVTAWKDGSFAFRNDAIEEVMAQLARWYGATVVYEGARPELPISGSIPTTLSLDDALAILQGTGVDAAFEVEGKTVKVSKLDTP